MASCQTQPSTEAWPWIALCTQFFFVVAPCSRNFLFCDVLYCNFYFQDKCCNKYHRQSYLCQLSGNLISYCYESEHAADTQHHHADHGLPLPGRQGEHLHHLQQWQPQQSECGVWENTSHPAYRSLLTRVRQWLLLCSGQKAEATHRGMDVVQ